MSAASRGRCAAKCRCSCPTVITPRGARRAASRLKAGRVVIRTPPSSERSQRSKRDVGPQAGERIDVVLGVDEQARQAVEQTLALEHARGHPGREGEERPLAAAHEADQLDVAGLREMAGDGQRGPDRPAHAPGVGEQDAHRAVAACRAPAREQGGGSERRAVDGHRERPEQAASQRLGRHGRQGTRVAVAECDAISCRRTRPRVTSCRAGRRCTCPSTRRRARA